jgi:hypothetical protein
MPRGGARPGSGPLKAALREPAKISEKVAADIRAAARSGGMTPLEYMLGVMNDEAADEARRDRMAQAAAPYVHPKAGDAAPGKKEQQHRQALTAERGTDWEALLQ